MTGHLGQHARDLLAAPLHVQRGIDRLGRSLWLYVRLVAIANASGHICRTLDSLANDLGVQPGQAEVWLARLVHVGLVSVLTPPPYLVTKLRFWSASDDETSRSSGQNGDSHREVPVSSKQAAAAALKKTEDGGAGEGGGEFVAEVLQVLGETDAGEFRELIEQLPRPVVLKALLRVKSTPSDQIRKSRAALFRYLLNKFSRESHATTPPHQT